MNKKRSNKQFVMPASSFYRVLAVVLLVLSTATCKSTEPVQTNRDRSQLPNMVEKSPVFSDNFTGFVLYDPASGDTIYAQNEKRYFTPASNTKLLTFFTGLKLLPDTLPALKYVQRGDSLLIWGTGDPSFLRGDLDNGTVYDFLKDHPGRIYYSDAHYQDEGLGPGWAWGDYEYAYSAEKSPFPMYGNMAHFTIQEVRKRAIASDSAGLKVDPPYFRSHVQRLSPSSGGSGRSLLSRGFSDNTFGYLPRQDTTTVTVDKPYHYTPSLIADMLADTLNRPVGLSDEPLPETVSTLYSITADSAYKAMLQPSDNFIAEQLLLAAAARMGGPLRSEMAIDTMKARHLNNMPDEPQWVDGSGLSRYNMFTPRSMIWLLERIDDEYDSDEALFKLLAAGGQSGTIRNWYGNRNGGPPYVFAKTGTLSNNHCLSGYLITESGRKLLFSFMNNHYVTSSSVVKEEMEKVLWYIHRHL